MADLSLAFDILARDRASGTFDKVGRSAGDLGSKLSNVGKIAATAVAGAGVAAVAGLGAAMFQGIKDAVSYETITKQLAATLKATGNAAGTSVEDMQKLAASLETLSGVDEELILNSQNVLATFKNISNNGPGSTFDEATKAALNLSTTMGGDLQGASVLVGKALNDPVKGLTALSRAGVGFTQSQKDAIKMMVAAGDTMGAQKIILGELEGQFGGAAEAAGSGFAGDLARLKDAFSDTFRDLGAKVLPFLADFAAWLSERLPAAIDTVTGVLGAVARHISEFWTALTTGFTQDEGGTWWENLALALNQDVLPVLEKVVGFVRGNLQPILIGLGAAILAFVVPPFVAWAAAQLAAIAPIVAVGAAIAALVAAVIYAYEHFEGFRNVVDAVAQFFTGTVVPAVRAFVSAIISKFGELADYVGKIWPQIEEAVGHVIEAIKTVVEAGLDFVKGVWRAVGDEVLGYVRTVWQTIKNVIDASIKAIQGVIQTVLALINGDWGKAWDGIKQVLAGVWDSIKAVVRGGIEGAHMVLKGGLDLIKLAWDGVWNGIKGAFGAVWDAIKSVARDALEWIVGKVRSITKPIETLLGLLGQVESKGSKVGGVNIGGIAQSLTPMFGAPGDPSQAAGLISAVESRDEIRRRLAEAVDPTDIADLHRQLISAQQRVEDAATSVFEVGSKTVQNFQELARRAGLSADQIQAITAPITATLEQEAARALDAVFEEAGVAFQFGAESGAARRSRLIAELLAGRSLEDIASGVSFQASQERRGTGGAFQVASSLHVVVDLQKDGRTETVYDGPIPAHGQKVRALVRGA